MIVREYLDGLIQGWGIQGTWGVFLVQAIGMAIFALLLFVYAAVVAGVLSWVERRIAGRMQSRIGPNRVGPQGALQWVADGLKCLLKEDLIPAAADAPLFKIAPYLVFLGMFGTFVVLPFSSRLIAADLNVGVFYLMAITAFVAVGIIVAGWSSNNKWALLGGMRSAAQIISYEIPGGLALLAVVLTAGTMSTQGIVRDQGWAPWQWNIFHQPFLLASFFIYYIASLAEINRTPFDLPEGESELVAGYNVEYSGFRFALFFLAEWADLYVISAIATVVFLGGWQVPDIVPAALQGPAQVLVFLVKAFTMVFVGIWVKWTLPRVRVDQMTELCWKYLVPIGFVNLLGTAAWVALVPRPHPVGLVVSLALTALGLGVGLFLLARVRYNLRTSQARLSFNPFV